MTPAQTPSKFGQLLRSGGRNLGMLLALLASVGVIAAMRPQYLSPENLIVVALQMSFVGIAALGTAQLMISGNIDLSIGPLFALTATVAAILAKSTSPAVAAATSLALGTAIGFANGALVWRIKLSPLIVTLGSMAILRGVVLLATGGYAVRGVPKEFGALGQARWLGLPTPLWALLLLSIAVHLVLTRTSLGRHIYAVGGSREACTAVGIPVRRLVLGAFTVNGTVVALAGLLAASRFGSASPSFGTALELDVITAVILGGVAFTGGDGNVLGVLLAVLLLGVINSGIVTLGINPYYAEIVKGAALILAVGVDQLSQEGRDKYRRLLAMAER
jgi:ribose/xylose/arabinose/galactoside ABC-type transport system permease subunit